MMTFLVPTCDEDPVLGAPGGWSPAAAAAASEAATPTLKKQDCTKKEPKLKRQSLTYRNNPVNQIVKMKSL
jgi:hypothetical protein